MNVESDINLLKSELASLRAIVSELQTTMHGSYVTLESIKHALMGNLNNLASPGVIEQIRLNQRDSTKALDWCLIIQNRIDVIELKLKDFSNKDELTAIKTDTIDNKFTIKSILYWTSICGAIATIVIQIFLKYLFK